MILTNSTTHQLLTKSFPGFYGNYLLKDKTKKGIGEENLEKEKKWSVKEKEDRKDKGGKYLEKYNVWSHVEKWDKICWRRKKSQTNT